MHPAIRPVLPAPPDTTVSRLVVGRRTILSVDGEIDMGSVPLLADAVDRALDDGALELWIDLSGTSFMDSSGLHQLLAARRRALGLNRRLAVICPGGHVRRLFEISGVGDHLPLYESRAAAHLAA